MKRYIKELNKKWIITIFVLLLIGILGIIMLVHGYKKIEKENNSEELKKFLREEKYFIYGANSDSPPLRFLDIDGVYKGVVVDYMSLLALELGIEIRTEPYQWEKALKQLEDGKTDFCDMYVNEERSQKYVFTDPIYNIRTGIVIRKDTGLTENDIYKMKIATEKGDYANTYLKAKYPAAELVYVQNIGEGISQLIEKKVDAVVGDEPILSYFISKKELDVQHEIIYTSLFEEPVVLAMPKDHQELIPIMNDAIRKINQQGQLEKIQQKWFGISTPLIQSDQNSKYAEILLSIALILMTIILGVSINNYYLKKLVRIRTSELETNRNELQMIFDSIPEFILILDKDRNIKNANASLSKYADLNIDNYVGQPVEEIFDKLNLDDKKEISSIFESDKEKFIFKSKKDILEVQVYNVNNQEEETLITIRDITLDEINRKKLLQSSKMLAVGQLAGGMAHQIRNPLSVIRMHSYMLKENDTLNEQGKKSIRYIEDSVKKANSIIDNVMNFWQISGNYNTKINMYLCLKNIVELHDNIIKKKNLTSIIDCDENLCIISNEEALKHILVNLISNAIDALNENGYIKISAEEKNEEIEIICEDNGVGISEENLEHLFNPFFTTKDPGKGTGLGLFIVYSEVEKLSGTIKVESKEGIGTKFTIDIPNERK